MSIDNLKVEIAVENFTKQVAENVKKFDEWQGVLSSYVSAAMSVPANVLNGNSTISSANSPASTAIRGFSAGGLIVDNWEWRDLDHDSNISIENPPKKFVRKHKIGDLIMAEVTKAKLKDYDDAKRIDYALLGVLDFCDFVQEENLGKISELAERMDLVWKGITIRYNKDEQRDIFLHRKYSVEVNNISNIVYSFGGNNSGKSLLASNSTKVKSVYITPELTPKDFAYCSNKFYMKYTKKRFTKV